MVRTIRFSNEDSSHSLLSNKKKRKKKSISSNVVPSVKGGQLAEVMYHCNNCKKGITEMIRIKCAVCQDFDLCVECFSVGVELTPHKNNHPYRVTNKVSFPVLCDDWKAEEELLLLEGLEIFGMNNWDDLAKHVGTKTKSVCIEHYNTFYMNSPCFPLPDMSRVMGKSKEELLVMDKEQAQAQAQAHMLKKTNKGMESVRINATPKDKVKGKAEIKEDEDHIVLLENNKYNSKRHEFDVEYDNDAEQLIADLEFNETDTKAEHELKLRVLHVYNRRIDKRNYRKDFVIEMKLHLPDPFYDTLSPEEKKIYDFYWRFMRFTSNKEEFDKLIRNAIGYQRTLKKINNLKEAQAAGCITSAQAERYFEQKRLNDEAISTGSMEGWGVSGFPWAELLSKLEERVCVELRMMPRDYMDLLEKISMGVLRGDIKNKFDAYGLCNYLDATKFDKLYDVISKKLDLIKPSSSMT